jgi:response regulator of citrate/malate metabolism
MALSQQNLEFQKEVQQAKASQKLTKTQSQMWQEAVDRNFMRQSEAVLAQGVNKETLQAVEAFLKSEPVVDEKCFQEAQ